MATEDNGHERTSEIAESGVIDGPTKGLNSVRVGNLCRFPSLGFGNCEPAIRYISHSFFFDLEFLLGLSCFCHTTVYWMS